MATLNHKPVAATVKTVALAVYNDLYLRSTTTVHDLDKLFGVACWHCYALGLWRAIGPPPTISTSSHLDTAFH